MPVAAKQVKFSLFCKTFQTGIPPRRLHLLFNPLFPKYSYRTLNLYKYRVLASIWLNQMFLLRSTLQVHCRWQSCCRKCVPGHWQFKVQAARLTLSGWNVQSPFCVERDKTSQGQRKNIHLEAWWYLFAIPSCFHCFFLLHSGCNVPCIPSFD